MNSDFSRNLSLLRKEKHLSQRKVAETLGISQALLSHYENGIREPGLSFVVRACDFYQVSADFLLGRTLSRDGAMIDAQELYDVSAHKDNVLKGSVLAQLNKKLLVNSLTLVYGILGRLDNRELISLVSSYFSCAFYTVFRLLYRINKANSDGFFSLDQRTFQAGAVDLSLSRAQYDLALEVERLREDKDTQKAIEHVTLQAAKKEYPALYQSLLQIVHNTSNHISRSLAAERSAGGRK